MIRPRGKGVEGRIMVFAGAMPSPTKRFGYVV